MKIGIQGELGAYSHIAVENAEVMKVLDLVATSARGPNLSLSLSSGTDSSQGQSPPVASYRLARRAHFWRQSSQLVVASSPPSLALAAIKHG